MAMEYLAGRDLARVVAEDFPLGEDRIVRIGAQVLSALAEAHAQGVIHRDLKPENVMVAPRRGQSRPGQGAGLRDRQDRRRRRGRAQAHPGRAGVRHPGVHEPGAGAGSRPRRPQRPLLHGRAPLPALHRSAAVPVGHAGRASSPPTSPRRRSRPGSGVRTRPSRPPSTPSSCARWTRTQSAASSPPTRCARRCSPAAARRRVRRSRRPWIRRSLEMQKGRLACPSLRPPAGRRRPPPSPARCRGRGGPSGSSPPRWRWPSPAEGRWW